MTIEVCHIPKQLVSDVVTEAELMALIEEVKTVFGDVHISRKCVEDYPELTVVEPLKPTPPQSKCYWKFGD